MNDLQEALAGFWARFAPAYLMGHVPDGARFPYITFEAARPDALGQAFLAAWVWCRMEPGGDVLGERARLMDRIARAIPPSGLRLPAGDGFILLERNPSGFQTLLPDPVDPSVIGGRIGYTIRFYHL